METTRDRQIEQAAEFYDNWDFWVAWDKCEQAGISKDDRLAGIQRSHELKADRMLSRGVHGHEAYGQPESNQERDRR